MAYCLVYISDSTELFDIDELIDIGREATRFNAKRDISGILIYSGKHFIQVLEGSKSRVELLYNKIANDVRHENCRILLAQHVTKRSFQSWHMGVLNVTGHKELDSQTLQNMAKHASTNPDSTGFTALTLLKAFRSMLPDPNMDSTRAA